MELGRLEEVEVRTIWEHEAHDFTPWLLEHEDHLAETLGIDLELERSEHPVGGFSLDLVGRDLTNDAVLIVENQLERTDHGHLGQILTYAAGTDASSIVWIATSFQEEHRQAIDWLNEQTRENVRFFGIELQAVRIGTSLPAPLFKLVAQPNDWQKQVRSATRSGKVGTKTAMYQQFWTTYLERLREEHPDWSRARTPSNQNWMDFPSPIRGTRINPSFAHGRRLRHEVYIDYGDKDQNETLFEHLSLQRELFEANYGRAVEWEALPNARACRIADYRDDADVTYEDRHDEFIAWFLDAGERLRRALASMTLPET
ncbi:MAG: DUF4268 domain-containing protein [Acidimicrobiales bacterium]